MFGRQRKGGVLEVDLPNAKVIWRLRWDEFNLCDEEDYMYERFTVYGLDCSLVFRPMFYFHLDVAGEFEVHAVINGEEFTLTQNKRQVSPNRVPAGKDVEIVIHFVRLAPNSLTDALPKLLLKSHLQKTKALRAAEGEAKRLDGELQESEAETKRLAAEVDRCHALINAGSHQAAERECRLTGSAVKIEAKWRQVLTRRRFLRERDETDRRLRQAKQVRAILCLQTLWRLKQKKCQRRWLHAQNGCSNTETPYDAILAFDSLAEFLKEGKIEFLQKAESLLEIAKESRYRVVAVVGLFDKGKTWLLNKLFGANLPAGKLCTTKGLSFLWIKERRMLVLDSAGVQSTVSYRAQAVDAIHDAQTTESLMFEMVSRISHRMVFVVNDLTWFEQKYVAMLHQKYVQCKQHKELIVVHNLRNTCDVAEASMLFRRQVMQCYDGEPSHQAKLIFTADLGEGVPPVHHIGLCYEFSKAGDAFKSTNREYLLQSLEHGNTLGTNIVLTDLLCSELSRLLPKFVNIETIEPEASAASEQAVSVIFQGANDKASVPKVEGTRYASSGTFCMRLSNDKARVTTKTRGVISPLGEIIAHDVSFDPIVNVFDKAIDTGVQRFIRIECPGIVEEEIEWQELPNGVKVTINKKPPIEEHAVQPVEPIRQHHGMWEREFFFDQTEGRFELCEDEAMLENGVLTMVLKKAPAASQGALGQSTGSTPGCPCTRKTAPSAFCERIGLHLCDPGVGSGVGGCEPKAGRNGVAALNGCEPKRFGYVAACFSNIRSVCVW